MGLVPAAGYGRRLQPSPHSKEVLPVLGKPVMTYLVERMRLAGAVEIRVVTRPEKKDVIDQARVLGAKVVHGHPESVGASFGMGMAGLEDDAIILLGFPDTIWYPEEGFRVLLEALHDRTRLALGLFETTEPNRSDVVMLDGDGLVSSVDVKPLHPRSRWLWGCAAGHAGLLRGLDGFAEPGHFFDWLCRRQPVAGIRLSAHWIDIGTPDALARSGQVAALQHRIDQRPD